MDQKTDNILTYILYFSLTVVLLFVLAQNIADPWVIIVLSGLIIGSITTRNAVIYPSPKYNHFGKFTILIDLILVFIISLIDQGTSSSVFYYLLIADCSIAYSPLFTGLFTVLCYLTLHLSQYITKGYPDLITLLPQMGLSSLSFIGVFVIMYLVKYEIGQRRKLSQTMYELKIKSKQLENTYLKLKEASEELEDLTIVSERNRIAREIHDTVGHTLTTVLLELEAGERLIPINPETAAQKIGLAKSQVRKGLQDIRESVKTLQAGRELLEFVPSLKLLMEETTKHGEIFIKYDIKELPMLTSTQEKAIYRALQEGLTNGIRHGNSTAFVLVLAYENDNLKFMLQDNGVGSELIVKGFGLAAMEERVKELGGLLMVQSSPGEGFQISITIPIGRDELNETN
jgi:signal transduction histidine kinase